MKEIYIKNFWPSEIIKDNCAGMCSQKYCSEPYTKYFNLRVNREELFIGLCLEHSDKMVEAQK